MDLCVYISYSWFALNQQLADLCKNKKPNTQYILYVPTHLGHKINKDYIKMVNEKTSSRINILEYVDIVYETKDKFIISDTTKVIDFNKFNDVELHFDLSCRPEIDNFGSLLIAHHFLKHAQENKKKIKIHVWEYGISSLSNRKVKPQWLDDNFDAVLYVLNSSDWSKSLVAFINGGCYLLNHIYPTIYHFVRPELSDKWYLSGKLSILPISLNKGFSKEGFKLYLTMLGITTDDIQKIKNVGDTLIIKEPLGWFRLAVPMKNPGIETGLNYDLIFNDFNGLIDKKSRITILSGERDSIENLDEMAKSIKSETVDFTRFTLESLFYLKAVPKKIISFFNLYAYLLPPTILSMLVVNENESFLTINSIEKDTFNCPVIYLDETKKMYPDAENYVVCDTPEPLGDSLFAIACLPTLKEKFQKKIMTIGKFFSDESLFSMNKLVDISINKKEITPEAYSAIYYGSEHSSYISLLPNKYNARSGHIINNTLREFNLAENEDDLSIKLAIIDSCEKIDEIDFSKKTVLLHPNDDAKNRSWSQQQWSRLAELFINDGWQVILIGNSQTSFTGGSLFDINHSGIINFINKLKLSETLYLMSKSQLLVACDSGPVALAGATDIAIAALYSIVKGERRIPYRHGELGWNSLIINLPCHYANCIDLVRNSTFMEKMKPSLIDIQYAQQPYDKACLAKARGDTDAYHCLKAYPAENLFLSIKKVIKKKVIITS